MIFIELFWTFFKIGLFCFGGGYAMVPLIQREIISHQWLPLHEFADIVAVSQMTPGPIAVNSATYVGFRTAGFAGAACSTFGVALPSFFLIIIVASFFKKFTDNHNVNNTLKGIRPVTVGMIASAVWVFLNLSVFMFNEQGPLPAYIEGTKAGEFFQSIFLNPGALLIFILSLFAIKKLKAHPILIVLVSAGLGIILC